MIKTPVCWPILLRGPPRLGLPISGYTALELLKGDNKMNMKQLCTATDRTSRRERINFRMEEKQIKKLRRRMVRAYRLYELGSVAVLQGAACSLFRGQGSGHKNRSDLSNFP